MANRLLIQSDPHQTRVAVLEQDHLVEIYLELRRQRGVVGNIYKGQVSRILPGMQAAFVDIGLARDAFLYAGDVRDALTDMDALAEADPQTAEFPPQEVRPIEELLRRGQDLLVQVVKEPLPNKGARITTEITLPGRYLVLVPTLRSLGVSRRIRDAEERERLRAILESLDAGEHGMIVRTAGEGKRREEFESDLEALVRRWESIAREAETALAPTVVHQDQDLALRVLRDRLDDTFEEVLVDAPDGFERVVRYAEEVEPKLRDRIRRFEAEGALFDRFGVEAELEAALNSKVWLKSGGHIVISPTEALVAIDVNTGRFVGRTSLEDTVVRTNLEAAEEIVRQIRLRDLSGIIVIDFIDMSEPGHQQQVFDAFQRELQKDRAKSQVLGLSDFGLVELTRKRSRSNLTRLLTRPCPHCEGTGRILKVATVCLNLRREVLLRLADFRRGGIGLRVHPEVLEALRGGQRAILEELAREVGGDLRIEEGPDLHHDLFEIVEV
ncbi:MAG: Rne/Rng family ribonuclease [Thermoanaerobaculia bacterium]|nr:Rne/Rng family ribonuclease [Thermoanaerobaculia bacterium]